MVVSGGESRRGWNTIMYRATLMHMPITRAMVMAGANPIGPPSAKFTNPVPRCTTTRPKANAAYIEPMPKPSKAKNTRFEMIRAL